MFAAVLRPGAAAGRTSDELPEHRRAMQRGRLTQVLSAHQGPQGRGKSSPSRGTTVGGRVFKHIRSRVSGGRVPFDIRSVFIEYSRKYTIFMVFIHFLQNYRNILDILSNASIMQVPTFSASIVY